MLDVETFIHRVRAYKNLYDPSDAHYKNCGMVDMAQELQENQIEQTESRYMISGI